MRTRSKLYATMCDELDDPRGRHHEAFDDERMTAALLDRLTIRGHVLLVEGESYGRAESLKRHGQ